MDYDFSVPFSECSSTSAKYEKCGEKYGKVVE
jgi:hypothetical protein